MSEPVQFYFDYGSPTTYLAWTQLPQLCERHGATLEYVPVLLGGIFKETDNQSPVLVAAKGRWMQDDMARFAARYQVPFLMNPHFMINTLPLMRGAVWAQRDGVFDTYNDAVFRAMWVDGIDMNDATEIGRVIQRAGLDGTAMMQAIGDAAIKGRLIDNTSGAVARGVFGAPTVFVHGEMHFGQDRLDWVEQALQRRGAAA